MDDPRRDTLSRWWWPGRWLRIVYGVWVDQMWYWQQLRPRLGRHPQGWAIFGQAVLGAALASALAVAPVIWAVGPAARPEMALGAAIGLVLLIIVGAAEGCFRSLADGVAVCAACGPAYAVALGLAGALVLGSGWDAPAGTSLALAGLWSAILGLSAGWGRGLYTGVSSGVPGPMRDVLGDALLIGVVAAGPAAHGIAAWLMGAGVIGVAFLAGHWMGGRWSTRQLDRRQV